jgi:hypothetical protein
MNPDNSDDSDVESESSNQMNYYYSRQGQFKEIYDFIDEKTNSLYSEPYINSEKIREIKEQYALSTLGSFIKDFKSKITSLWNQRCLISVDYEDSKANYMKFCSHIYESIKMLEQKATPDDPELIQFKKVMLSQLNTYHDQLNLGFLKQRFDEIECELGTVKSLINEVTELFPSSTCNVCLERQVMYFIDPCGHTLCEICKARCTRCPMCRGGITELRKLYF